jgi:acyl-CoA synthetase (AMP-forming)/AMP-acid ligase II
MHLGSLVEMVESGFDQRVLMGKGDRAVTGADLGRLARAGASQLAGYPALVYVGENRPLLPVALFAAAWAGIPFAPVNYRLEDHQLNSLVARQPGALVLADEHTAPRVSTGGSVQVLDDWLASLPTDPPPSEPPFDDDEVAIVLYTSGTTSEPKSALLRHRHLMAYLLGSVKTPETIEFRDSLPHTETGKLLRRIVQSEFLATHS